MDPIEEKVDPKEPEGENLPAESTPNSTVTEIPAEPPVDKLALENAELKGKLSVLESIRKETPQVDAQAQWKQLAQADMNSLDDDTFEAKYKYKKHQVSNALLEQEMKITQAKSEEKIAKLEAHQTLMAEFGSDYARLKSQVEESLQLVSQEVRQNPEKLAKYMRTAYLAAERENPSKKEEVVERKNLTTGFEKPSTKKVEKKSESDEIPEEYRSDCQKFGITSEKERQELMKSEDCVTDFGGGYVLRDRNKGFEKVA